MLWTTEMSWNQMAKDSESMKRTKGPEEEIADPVPDQDHVAAQDLEAGMIKHTYCIFMNL